MTVIAYDGKYIAADRRVTNGDFLYGEEIKIVEWSKGVWASTGGIYDGAAFATWLETKHKPKHNIPKLNKSFAAFFTEDGEVFEIDRQLVPYKAYPNTGLGSGGEAASILMKTMGLSAFEACVAVCKVNVTCGLPVDVVRVNE